MHAAPALGAHCVRVSTRAPHPGLGSVEAPRGLTRPTCLSFVALAVGGEVVDSIVDRTPHPHQQPAHLRIRQQTHTRAHFAGHDVNGRRNRTWRVLPRSAIRTSRAVSNGLGLPPTCCSGASELCGLVRLGSWYSAAAVRHSASQKSANRSSCKPASAAQAMQSRSTTSAMRSASREGWRLATWNPLRSCPHQTTLLAVDDSRGTEVDVDERTRGEQS